MNFAGEPIAVAALPNQDMLVISRLATLQQLTLSCPLYCDGFGTCLDVAPLSKLTNLRQLTVVGFIPMDQGSGGIAVQLPASLTYMCCAATLDFSIMEGWASPILAATCLRRLQLVEEDLGHLQDISPLQNLTALVCSYSPREDAQFVCYHQLPASMTSLSKLEVLRIEDKDPCYPWHQHFFISDYIADFHKNCPKLREIGPVTNESDETTTTAMVGVSQQHLTYLSVDSDWNNKLPGCMPARCFPHLQCLEVSDNTVSKELAQSICGHTQLTKLRLDTALVCVKDVARYMAWSGWSGLKQWHGPFGSCSAWS
jgi:hypothetical protein